MDCKNNNRSNNIVPQPNSSDTQSYFTESNAGHITVQTTSPFRMRDSELASEQNLKSKMDKSYIFAKKLPKTACSSTTSKLLVNQIIRETNIDGDGFVKEGHKERNLHGLHHIEKKSNYNQSFLINHVEIKRSAKTFISENSSVQLGLCSREETIVPAECANSKHVYSPECSEKSIQQKQYAEKATYCRPVLSFNNEFMNRTREKNIRLQRLVKKLVLAREREKETEALNDYINELKIKHDVNNNKYQLDHSSKSLDSGKADNFVSNFQTESTFNGKSPCNDLLKEIYNACGIKQLDANLNCPSQYYHQYYLENTSECYPMSSQGRLMIINKERRRNPFDEYWQYQSDKGRQFNGNTIIVDKKLDHSNLISRRKSIHTSHKKILTENYKVECGTYCIDKSYKEKYNHLGTQTSSFQEQYNIVSENVDRLKKKIQETAKCDETNVLKSIENKLDILITSLNSFMENVKSKTSVRQCYNCHSANLNRPQFKNDNMNISRSDTYGLIKAERLVCGLLAENTARPIPYSIHNRKISEKSCTTNINKMLIEETDSCNKVKGEIDSIILNSNPVRPCPVYISLDIPTKERSTEVTESFSKSKLPLQNRSVSIEEIPRDGSEEKNRKTLAVNTDPLGLLALLRVSTESVKQLLSYMPNFPYYSYLQMLPLPQTPQNSQFVCNICGAAFDRPSQLSDHIQGHDLGRTRDCCVCRHILDMQTRWPADFFRCQYCGQRFTRAYCCELHQESCAKRFGLKHDITPSLMLLR